MTSINSLTVLVTSEAMNCLFGATIGFQNLSMFISYDLDASFCHILAAFMIVALYVRRQQIRKTAWCCNIISDVRCRKTMAQGH